MADNEFLIGLVSKLDPSASKQNIERDILNLEKQLKNIKLKAEIDPSAISNIENQLKKLKASISNITVSPQAISNIVTQINTALNGLQINNININPNGFRQQGQQAGKLLSQGVEDALDTSITSKGIEVPFRVKAKDSDDFQNAVNKEIEELQKKSNTVVKVQYKTDTFDKTTTDIFGNEITQKVEKLTGAVFNYTTATGEAITKTMKWTQIGIDADDNPIMGWAQGLTTYTKSLGEASAKTNNFAKQQKATVANLLNQIKQINAAAIDPNASRSITDQTHLTTLKTKYDEITQAIQRMESASADTFVDEQNNVKSLIADFKILVSEYKNAENVRTSIKPDKIAESSSKVQSQFKSLQSNIIAANIPLDTMQDNLDSIQAVVDKIENKEIVSKAELENTLTLLQNCRDELKALKTEKVNASALEQLKYDAESLKSSLQTYGKQHAGFDSWKTQINGVEISVESLLEELQNVNNKTDFTTLEKKIKSFKDAFVASQDAITKLGNVQLKIDDGTYDTKVADLIAKTNQWTDANGNARISVDALNKAYKALNDAKDDNKKIEAAKKLEQAIKSTTNEIRKMNIEYAKDSQIASLHQKIQEFYDKNSAAHATYGDSLKKYLKDTEVGAELTQAELDKIATGFNNIKNQARQTGKLGLNLFDSIKTQAAKFGQWFSITSVISTGISEVKKMVDAVYEIDTAMTSLYKVTDETAEKYESFLNNATKKAQELGRSVSSYVEQTASWAKLGYNVDDSSILAETSSIYANVGEVDDETAVSDIVTAMKAYNIEAKNSIEIVNRLNNLGNKYATDSASLGEGLSKSASALALAGNDINQTLAMITGGTEITQNASEMGNALKVLSMRIRGMKGELEELGEEYDNVESISKIQTQILNQTQGAVNIFDDTGNFKSTYEIIEDISKVWDKISKTDQAALLETIAGKQRSNQVAALIQSFQSGQAQKAYEDSINSEGSAMREQERWMESLEARIQRFKAAFESLSNTVIDSDLLKGLIDGGTVLLNLLEELIDNFGILGTTIAGIGGFKFIKNFDQPKSKVAPVLPIFLG